ncbi:hypothetical protein [Streptomyces sp. 5-10]|uniref:hypothetical protein n=1 Tax=Streptomyces sp. 5-10 TaxID=878925 RepID=UPI00168B1040|nr:hypothetical protein [Streptomyces sp. 5-10]MBD3004865.1 hypothetical protein [Streptomyces sp. 5-10]
MRGIEDVRAAAIQAAATYLNGAGVTVEEVVHTADIIAAYIEGGEEGARRMAWEKAPREGGGLNAYEQEVLNGTPKGMKDALQDARRGGVAEVLLGQIQRMDAPADTPKTPARPDVSPEPPQPSRDPRAQRLLDAAIKSCRRKQIEMALAEAKDGGIVQAKVLHNNKEVPLRDALKELWTRLPKTAPQAVGPVSRSTSDRLDLGF